MLTVSIVCSSLFGLILLKRIPEIRREVKDLERISKRNGKEN
jgi:hypothetical protein